MVSTAADYFRFLQMWLDGGELGGARLLSEESVATATRSQTGIAGAAYGYGWTTAEDGSFGHGGSDGTWAWVDPAREIVGLVFTQSPGGRIPAEQFRRVVEASLAEH
jgi:CubicO group peptidase (beta-lactamase class C family)